MHQLFRNEIFSDPLNDEPRLVYADWLQDMGDPRGEFIAIQCQLAQMDWADPRLPALAKRELEMLDANPNWNSHFNSYRKPTRGFVESINARLIHMLANQYDVDGGEENRFQVLTEFFREHPIIEVTHWNGMTLPEANRIKRLSYFGTYSSDEKNISSFDLTSLTCALHHATRIKKIFGSKWDAIEQLALIGKSDQGDLNTDFDAHTFITNCESKRVSASLRPNDFLNLLGMLYKFPNFVALQLWVNTKVMNGLMKMAKKGAFANLKSLQLKIRETFLSEEEQILLNSLRESELTTRLEHLGLSFGEYDGTKALAELSKCDFSELRSLSLTKVFLDEDQIEISEALKRIFDRAPKLRRLNLDACKIDDHQFGVLLSLPEFKRLTHVRFAVNQLSKKAYESLVEVGPWEDLVAIHLENNLLDLESVNTKDELLQTPQERIDFQLQDRFGYRLRLYDRNEFNRFEIS